jgi:hypothetical protein
MAETAIVGWELLNEDEGDHAFSIVRLSASEVLMAYVTGTPAASGPKSG